ncbi:hypothetical protein C9374_010393 [Naegleria lovaniensis]|uniref:Uncharacterized protein n=1 Tax=Naegleria lovaniensis TaxID=51637 RepID=A0AA88KG46_NAELO|nr:uncharacterized protein C9374_010393 [Naegleria lovaniensis]KAG2375019.1 hypothetical protein C9374_010393 [Naegleria lovaniensis]
MLPSTSNNKRGVKRKATVTESSSLNQLTEEDEFNLLYNDDPFSWNLSTTKKIHRPPSGAGENINDPVIIDDETDMIDTSDEDDLEELIEENDDQFDDDDDDFEEFSTTDEESASDSDDNESSDAHNYKHTLEAMKFIINHKILPSGFKLQGNKQVLYLFVLKKDGNARLPNDQRHRYLPFCTPSYSFAWIHCKTWKNSQGVYEKYYRSNLVPFRAIHDPQKKMKLYIEQEMREEVIECDKQLNHMTCLSTRVQLHSSNNRNINNHLNGSREKYQYQYRPIPNPPGGKLIIQPSQELIGKWKDKFKEDFPDEDLIYEFKSSNQEASLKINHLDPSEHNDNENESVKLISNNVARLFLTGHIEKWLNNRSNKQKSKTLKMRFNQHGLAHIEWLKEQFPQIDDICTYVFNTVNSKSRKKKKKNGFLESEETFLSGLSIFLNYAIFVLNKLLIPEDFFQYFLDTTILDSYLFALNDDEQLQYLSPNTRRRKVEALSIVLNYLSQTRSLIHNFDIGSKLMEAKSTVNTYYTKTNKERDEWLAMTHAMSHLQRYGKYMTPNNFWKCIKRSYHIILAWTKMFYSEQFTQEQKLKLVTSKGNQFMENFIFWFSMYTYANRAQVYYQSLMKDVKCFEFKDPVTQEQYYQFYFIFDTVRNAQKMHRTPDEACFPLGIANCLLIHFYTEFLPIYIDSHDHEKLALAYTPSKTPITIHNSRGKGFRELLKRVTKEHGKVALNNQLIRTHYNSHIKDLKNLSAKDLVILDKGMNHSRITADKHYRIFQQPSTENGNSIIDNQINDKNYSTIHHKEFQKRFITNLLDMNLTESEILHLEHFVEFLKSKRTSSNHDEIEYE